VQLADGSDLSYVEDGTACGPNMLCLDHHCLPASAFNFSTCPGSGERRVCSHHGVRARRPGMAGEAYNRRQGPAHLC
jgi:disintegrin and metalloproteinase domain-containing protein 11